MQQTKAKCLPQGQILAFWNDTCSNNDPQHYGEESVLLLEEAVTHRPMVSDSSDRPVQFIDGFKWRYLIPMMLRGRTRGLVERM